VAGAMWMWRVDDGEGVERDDLKTKNQRRFLHSEGSEQKDASLDARGMSKIFSTVELVLNL
jgi:hypothetical protein